MKNYLAHPDLAQRANALLDQSNKRRAILNQPEFETQRGILLRSIETYVQNNFAESKDWNWRYNKEGAILGKAEAYFNERLRHYQSLYQ